MHNANKRLEELRGECISNWNQILEASSKEEKRKLLMAGAKLRMERYYLRHGLEWPPKKQTKEGAL